MFLVSLHNGNSLWVDGPHLTMHCCLQVLKAPGLGPRGSWDVMSPQLDRRQSLSVRYNKELVFNVVDILYKMILSKPLFFSVIQGPCV